MALIELKELSKVYGFGEASTLALDEVNLSVKKGEFIAVMGPSGSGKTTLLNVIGLLDRPSHGEYKLDNQQVARLRPNRRAKLRREQIGFIFQSYNLIQRLNVLENVALPLAYSGVRPVKRWHAASDMLERVGMREREYFMPRHLSSGQAQRAAIARALVNKPSIIIADEPTGNLDSFDSQVIMELFSEIHKRGNTIMLVTHNPELTRYASRVIYMYDGSLVGDEKTSIGSLARGARRIYYGRHRRSAEDITAGVSALMHDVPGSEVTSTSKTKKRRRVTKKRTVRKTVKR